MMGSSFSKKPNSPSQGGGSSSNSGSNHSSTNSDINGSSNGGSRNQYIRELSSYQSDPDQDPDLESFDSALQHRTIGAISMLAGSEINSISFNTLMEVTGCLLDNNQQVVNMILEYKKDVWKNPELFDVVQEFFDCSLRTLDFCTALEKCLKRARDSQLIIHIALKHSEGGEEGDGKDKYERTLDELQRFKNIGNPFTAEFFQAFQSVYSQQVSMFEKLKRNKRKLDKKLKSVKAWRRVSNIIFVSAFAAILICSVVSAVMAAPAVAAALAAAAAIPLGSVGKWVDSLWKDYSKVLKGQKDVLNIMQAGTFVAITDLDSIRALVERLEIHIGSLMQNVDIVLGDEEAVKFGIAEIKKKMEEFMRGVESLGKQVDRCSRDIQRARTVVLQRIIRHPE